jgi:hypothetical protein
MELTVKTAGALASAMVLGAVLLVVFMRLMGSKPEPVVALELAETPEQVRNILDQDGRDVRGGIRKATYVDFIFIAAYWLLFIALSALLAQRDITLAVPLAVVAAVCATAAAQVDFLENLRLFALLDTAPEASDAEISRIAKEVRDAALLKFGLSFVAVALLSQVFLWRDDWWLHAIGILYLIAAAIGLFGVWWYPAAVQWGFFLLAIGIIPIAVVFTLIPHRIVASS